MGVSHSAPAHHFGDTNGLLDAIAADGFKRLLDMMETYHAERGPDPREALTGTGLGYVMFARSSPATFGLMFGPVTGPVTGREASQDLDLASMAAFEHLAAQIEALTHRSRESHPAVMQDVLSCWGMVHGLADLIFSGKVSDFQAMSDEEQLEFFSGIIRRALLEQVDA